MLFTGISLCYNVPKTVDPGGICMNTPQILDGATGTMLQQAGMPTGVSPELWVLEHPEVAENFQRRYVQAGSQVLYAPTFGANRVKLARWGAENRLAEINRDLVAISRRAAEGKALVAGDLSPTGCFLAPVGDKTFEELVDIYAQQAGALEQAGVDLYVVETVMSLPDARAAVLGIRTVSRRPIYVTFTVDERGRTLTGTDALAALLTMQAMGVTAFGLNCSSGPETMLRHLERLAPYARVPLIAKPNAGLPRVENEKTVYDCPPEQFTALVGEMARRGVRIFGGCCGTTPEHIAALSEAVHGLDMDWSLPVHDAPRAAVTEREAVFFEEIGEEDCIPVVAGEDLEDDLMDASEEDETFVLLKLSCREEAEEFIRCQYALHKPLILETDSEEALETALRGYQGVALYRGGVSGEALERLKRSYGVQAI